MAGIHDTFDPEDGSALLESQDASWLRPECERSLVLRMWQKFCLYIPALIFSSYCIALLACIIARPLYVVILMNVTLCWGIWEHSRWAANGVLAMRRVVMGVIDADESDIDDTYSTQHACFVATYKEDTEVLRQTLLSLANQTGKGLGGQSFARSFIGVNLCYEQREGGGGLEQAALLINEFEGRFAWMKSTVHPSDIPGDLMGKCSNMKWAIARSQSMLATPSTLVTVLDADSLFDSRYFSEVTAMYEEKGFEASSTTIFQPTILHFANYYEQIDLIRASSILASVANAAYHEDCLYLQLPYSSFTLSWELLDKIDTFSPDYVNDDWHTGTKAVIAEPLKAEVVHVPLPVVNYAVQDESVKTSFEERITQAMRHALGVEEIVYMFQMIPTCIARQWIQGAGLGEIFQIQMRIWRHMAFMVSVHIRMALYVPDTFAFFALAVGMLRSWQTQATEGWPLYGETLWEFAEHWACLSYICFSLIWWLFCVVVNFTAVYVAKHLVATRRITGAVPWWGKTWFQYLYELPINLLMLTGCYFFGGAAEIRAIFRVPFLDKKAFIFNVAPKPRLSSD